MTARALTTGIDHLCEEAIERPHQYFGALRDEQPVAWSERHRTWVVTGHPECLAAFKDPALSTDRLDAFTARQTPERAAALASTGNSNAPGASMTLRCSVRPPAIRYRSMAPSRSREVMAP